MAKLLAGGTSDEPARAAPGPSMDMEARIRARIRDFDVSALLALLEQLGYGKAAVRYRARFTSAPQPAWLDDIAFEQGLGGEVTVTANIGLLSCRSPLSSYFLALLQDAGIQEPLEELLRLIDDELIRGRFASYRPERDPGLFPDPGDAPSGKSTAGHDTPGWRAVKRDMLSTGALRAPSTLHWLFQQVFPELRVSVRRAPQARSMPAPGVQLGRGKLGSAAFDARAIVPVDGLEISLVCDERLSAVLDLGGGDSFAGTPWVLEARRRLDALILPILHETGLQLTVVLLVAGPEQPLGLDPRDASRERAAQGKTYLGYDALRPRPRLDEGGAKASLESFDLGTLAHGKPLRVVLFQGTVPANPMVF